LGSHLLIQLINNSRVKKIYCLIRTSQHETATDRLAASLKKHQMATSHPKIIPLSADFSKPRFNLSNSLFQDLKLEATHIIHCAWEVNFSLSIRSFEPQIQVLHNLLTLSMDNPEPAHLIFCSSIGTAMATPISALILSSRISDLHQASATGYARSKLVGERVVEAATNVHLADWTDSTSEKCRFSAMESKGSIAAYDSNCKHTWRTSRCAE
jgi:thioester reductase-like protein